MQARSTADRAARAALSAVVEPANRKVVARVYATGAEATWRAISRRDPHLDTDGVLARRAEGVDGAALLQHAAGLGIRFVCPSDAEWPAGFATMPDTLDAGTDSVPPPFGLWVRGNGSLAACEPRAIAVVGSRAASPYGRHVAGDIAADLAARGWIVVSGAAYGIDAAAHRGCLAMGGVTVAVLACGLDMDYPRSHSELLARIAQDGVVVSELAPGMQPMRSRFIARNRLIAALTSGTVVVEAARRSGALSTAHWAVKLGREVMAVPGPVTSEQSSGCHEWIRNRGAVLVTDADEVADTAGRLGPDAAPLAVGEERPLDRYSPDVRHVYERMPARAVTTVPDLARESGYPPPFVEQSLRELAAGGLVLAVLDGWVRVPGAA
ncbi:DNA-protecting protein DprA [Phytoactinopolyspora halotolerans]|uniref:DNA-protecting protein DprA n=1 Tax=Phytoactinopolyspora halotolerans TaxID=1981512 RepID=A0A6L9SF00_9ACTN|nr:DNA-protecting protein DprA [Phytoactinopolyspora halotolerans]